MAVTCSFEKRYGIAVGIADDGKTKYKMDIWSGGNCLMVFTQTVGKAKCLQYFVSDMQHLRNMAKSKDLLRSFFEEVKLSADLPYAKNVANVLIKCGVKVTVVPKGGRI